MPKEVSLYRPVIKLFTGRGFKSYGRDMKVPMSGKRVDLVFFKGGKEEKGVAVELKVDRWEEALFQAYINRFFFSKAYVALWHKNISRANIGVFKHYKVGLIEVDRNKARIIYEK